MLLSTTSTAPMLASVFDQLRRIDPQWEHFPFVPISLMIGFVAGVFCTGLAYLLGRLLSRRRTRVPRADRTE